MKLAIIIISVFLCSLFISCSNTEFPDDPDQTIIGDWETNLNRKYYTAGNIPLGANAPLMYRPYDFPKAYYEFSKDKTFNEFNQKGELVSYGTYKIENRGLTLRWDKKHSITYTIVSFGENKLWLRYSFYFGEYEGEDLMQIRDIVLLRY